MHRVPVLSGCVSCSLSACPHAYIVYKGKKVTGHQPKEEEKPARPEYIPVVGENEPELMPTGHVEGPKRKLDQAQMATDDLHYDRFKKKARMF